MKGTGKEPVADGQQKVANTALYVLMQRAIVPGCPLTGDGMAHLMILEKIVVSFWGIQLNFQSQNYDKMYISCKRST